VAETPEVKAKNRIKKEIQKILFARKLPAKIIWNAGNGLGVSRLDCDGVVAGHPFAIEVKRFDKSGKTTARQISDVHEYNKAGAFSMIVEDEESLTVFLGWLRVIEPRTEWGECDE
jgi:hypothetical protein